VSGSGGGAVATISLESSVVCEQAHIGTNTRAMLNE